MHTDSLTIWTDVIGGVRAGGLQAGWVRIRGTVDPGSGAAPLNRGNSHIWAKTTEMGPEWRVDDPTRAAESSSATRPIGWSGRETDKADPREGHRWRRRSWSRGVIAVGRHLIGNVDSGLRIYADANVVQHLAVCDQSKYTNRGSGPRIASWPTTTRKAPCCPASPPRR